MSDNNMNLQENDQSVHLAKVLGPIHVWALGVGVVLVGQFMGWNLGIVKGGSLGSIIACWVIGILYICLIMINTEMGTLMPDVGGQYAMAKYLLGPVAAFNIGLMLVFEYVMLAAADALVVGEILKTLHPDIQAVPYIIFSLLILTYINYKGAHSTLKLNIFLTGIAFLTIIVLLFSTEFYASAGSIINLENLHNGLPYGWIGVIGAFQFGCWFYLGIEGTVLVADECKSKNRAIPIGSVMGLVTLMIGATITWFVSSSLLSADTLSSSIYPLFDAAKATGKPIIGYILFVGTLLSCLASANGCIADASRAWYAMSKDSLIPEAFAVLHPVYKTPYRAIVFLLPIAIAFGFTGLLDQVVTFSILSALLVYIFVGIMMIKFRNMYPLDTMERGYLAPLHPLPSIVVILLSVTTIVGMYFGYFINLLSGLAFYFLASIWFIYHRSKSVDLNRFVSEDYKEWPRPVGYEDLYND